MIASRGVAARRLAGLAVALCLLTIQLPASIAVFVDPDEARPTMAGPPPRPDAPAAAVAFRQLQWKDRRGSYPANAFVEAKSHVDAMRARLREAAIRLAGRPGKVVDVALDCGFGDVSNFNRAFRAEFGVSPTRYRTSPLHL